ncbi:Ig-like domain-containing protein [Sedimentibacter sp. B4]|uniref:Ig-like domain-containing protein n=1 Tax=Sedimentibacter sp. B4 TaxID=304766 RepID=UPI0004B02059|nr:Ig-like domain-containing protein [Sedimentibacter sp. B4]
MNRKKQLLAWILAFVMVWIQLPAVEVFATTYDFSDIKQGDSYNCGYVVPGDKLLTNNESVKIFYFWYEVDEWNAIADIRDINTPILSIEDIPAAATAYQEKIDSGYNFLNWEIFVIFRSGDEFEFQLEPNWVKRVTSIDISSQALPDVTSSETLYKCFQMTATASPDDAYNKAVAWAVYDSHGHETDKATLTDDPSTGAKILKVKEAGEYRVRALAEDGFGTFKDFAINVEDIPVTGVEVSSENNATTVMNGSTLNMSSEITPENATNKNVTWSVTPGTGNATIDNDGVLTATAVGTVTVTATSVSNNTVYGTKDIEITPQLIAVSGIVVNSANDATSIVNGGTLNMSATITPENATTKSVTWSVTPGTGNATIDNNGVLTATAIGAVTVTAISVSNPNIYGTKIITITAPADNDDDDSTGGSSSQSKPVDPFQALSAADRMDIVNNLKEYLPYTLLECKGLTVEMFDTLTDHKFTIEYLKTLVNNPELMKKTFGIDVKAMIKYVSLEPVKNPNFKDITSHWAKDNIIKAANEGFASGLPEGIFAPDQALQSADTLTFLNRILLKNDSTYNKLPRSTVDKYLKDKDHWAYYYMASICAKLDEKTVETIMELEEQPITRELLAQILFELTKDYLEPIKGQEFGMKDIDESQYKEAIEFCLSTGLLYGTGDDTMSPKKVLTRAEMMTILTRLDAKLSR